MGQAESLRALYLKKIAGGIMDRNEQLFTFIEESPSPYHAVRTISRTLLEEGFQELKEQECWQLKAGGKYYVTRNGQEGGNAKWLMYLYPKT